MKTSNAGSADVQDLALSDGRPLWTQIAALVDQWGEDLVGDSGLSSVGAVVGATFPREVGEARRLMPRSVLLLPGVGEQGGTPADVARVPERPCKCARLRVAFGDLCLPPRRRRLAGRGRRGGAPLRAEVWAVSGW